MKHMILVLDEKLVGVQLTIVTGPFIKRSFIISGPFNSKMVRTRPNLCGCPSVRK